VSERVTSFRLVQSKKPEKDLLAKKLRRGKQSKNEKNEQFQFQEKFKGVVICTVLDEEERCVQEENCW
jgi:hypothetical protein